MAQFDLISSEQSTDTRRPVRQIQQGVALAIGILGLLIVLVVILLIDRRIRIDIVRIEETLVQIEERMAIVGEPLPDTQQLTAEIARVDDRRIDIENIALPPNIDWPHVVNTIRDYDPQLISLTSLVQSAELIMLEGTAASNLIAVDYAQQLEESHLFGRVDVQSIRSVRTTAFRPRTATRSHGLAKLALAPATQTDEEEKVQFAFILTLNLVSLNQTSP